MTPSTRSAIFAHYDAHDEVKDYIVHHLRALREVCDQVVFVSTSSLHESELRKVAPHCQAAYLKDNRGFDFGMWQHALDRMDPAGCDELVLTNSSVFGPIRPLADVFDRMAPIDCDFWSMTDSEEQGYHLQSWFLVFRRTALQSEAFASFFRGILPYRDAIQVIRAYELGLTRYLTENGLRPATLAAFAKLAQAVNASTVERGNPAILYPRQLIDLGVPYVKVQLLRDNPRRIPLEPVWQALDEAGYNCRLVTFDRPVTAPTVGGSLLARAVRRAARTIGRTA
jgi:rhamnosyltransferase